MTQKALITGIAGFAGSHLTSHLLSRGWEVAGIERHGASLDKLVGLPREIRVEECDVLSPRDVGAVIADYRPEVVFHLAGTTFVPAAQSAPQLAFEVNVKGSLTVFDETLAHAPGARMIFISSAEVYGIAPPHAMPLTEKAPRRPANIYALTKLCAENAADYYRRQRGMDIVILRPFTHIGPAQRSTFVTADFSLQIALIEAGKKPPVIEVGNLDARRDFTDVRDMVRAYRLAAEAARSGETYNIASGRAPGIRDVLDLLLSLTEAEIEIRPVPERMRESEIPVYRGDHSRFTGDTGWEPEYSLKETLETVLDYWRGRIRRR